MQTIHWRGLGKCLITGGNVISGFVEILQEATQFPAKP